MATRTEVVLVDDLDGETPAGTTVEFALDGTEYGIDLSEENAAAMRAAFSRYVQAARTVSSSAGRRRAEEPAKAAYSGYDPAAVRAWAAGQGITVSPRGRIRADVVEQYRAAGN
ncbi:histone-like nucleoid-structuring protein Lsr2 [Geodermatophilus maliterrae]|uniref:Lsr2 family protein n=1 Tax=Geodermatophilus maliterrae TaxID=3162531 RepID=A0ABV3XDF8_9ACTN